MSGNGSVLKGKLQWLFWKIKKFKKKSVDRHKSLTRVKTPFKENYTTPDDLLTKILSERYWIYGIYEKHIYHQSSVNTCEHCDYIWNWLKQIVPEAIDVFYYSSVMITRARKSILSSETRSNAKNINDHLFNNKK